MVLSVLTGLDWSPCCVGAVRLDAQTCCSCCSTSATSADVAIVHRGTREGLSDGLVLVLAWYPSGGRLGQEVPSLQGLLSAAGGDRTLNLRIKRWSYAGLLA
jgi:hypothetical protein